jgi:threonine/homoserine/homoserine lactone efflux protein
VDSQLLAYLGLTAVLVLTPGSTTAVVVRNTLNGGKRAGLAATVGAAVANTSHAAAAALGVALIVARWPYAMAALSFAGAGFLAWLGMRSLYNVIKYPDGGLKMSDLPEDDRGKKHDGSFREGLAVNLLNPAIATFYLVVIPSFQPSNSSRWYFAGLAAVHIGMALVCHGAWAFGLHHIRRWLRAPMARRLLEAATGTALIALAIRIVFR